MAAAKTFVYLMKDLRSGFIKIGYSNNPVYRERTLQSEQPLIELIEAWAGEKSDEKELHDRYQNVRVRGEWFRLTDEDMCEIKSYFYNHIKFSIGKSDDTLYLESHIEYLSKRIVLLEKHNECLRKRVDRLTPGNLSSAAADLKTLIVDFPIGEVPFPVDNYLEDTNVN